MKLFLHLELKKWQESDYEKPLLTFASALSSDLLGAEIDSQSEASIADLVIRLCDQMQSVFVFIQAQPDEPFGSSLKLLNHLLRTTQKIHSVVISGNHEQAQRLMACLGNKAKNEDDLEKIKIWIKEFALA